MLQMTFSPSEVSHLASDRPSGFLVNASTASTGAITYRMPLPDFVTRAKVERVTLISSIGLHPGRRATINGRETSLVSCRAAVPAAARPELCSLKAAFLTAFVAAREIELTIVGAQPNDLALAGGVLPSLLIQSASGIQQPVGWHSDDLSETTPMPILRPLFDYDLRDTSVRLAGDGFYYLTGSTGSPDMWAVTSDIQLWKSADLKTWSPVITKPRQRSVVWNIDRDGTWQKPVTLRDGAPFRPLWAPEIHYLKGTFWIPYSIPKLGTGLLRSTTSKPEGPYVSAIVPDGPLTDGIDASLFQDDDGAVYFLWAGGMIARMKPDLSGLAEAGRQLRPANAPKVGFEGMSLFKYQGRYYLSGADSTNGDYNCFTAISNSIYGPYSDRYISVPHGGHNNFFQDQQGTWWSTYFGSDAHSQIHERPAILKMHFDEAGELKPDV